MIPESPHQDARRIAIESGRKAANDGHPRTLPEHLYGLESVDWILAYDAEVLAQAGRGQKQGVLGCFEACTKVQDLTLRSSST